MNAIVNFNFETETVRVVMRGDEPWWVAADLCRILDIKNSRDAMRRLDDDEKGVVSTDTLGGVQGMNIVSESGMFGLVLGSRKAEAKRFRRWVTGEVLPSIRKTGRYQLPDDPPDLPSPAIEEDDLPKLTAAVAVMREARQVWGKREAQVIWIKLGLPSPIAEAGAEIDALAEQVAGLTAGIDRIRSSELAAMLGVKLDTRMTLRLGAALRALGFVSKLRRIRGAQVRLWERVGGDTVQ